MRNKFLILFLLVIAPLIIYRNSFSNFFAQDDFTLINQFSQNSLIEDLKNVFGQPEVTHWRPMHNFYFFIAGNIFGKNYIGYHILTFAILILSGTIIFEIVRKLLKNKSVALIASIIYISHPSHFVSMFWISGNATLIGFTFLGGSLYFYLTDKKPASLFLYFLSLMASEAMIVGSILILCISWLKKNLRKSTNFLIEIFGVSFIFALAKFVFLSNKSTFETYKISLSLNNLDTIKYYLSRIAGFAEVSGDKFASAVLLIWLIAAVFLLMRLVDKRQNFKIIYLSAVAIIVGLFPFILIPGHVSAHYMNISTFGFSIAVAAALTKQRVIASAILLSIFILVSVINVNSSVKDNWVIKRSSLAKTIIGNIQKMDLSADSLLVFDDGEHTTSLESYYALGTGDAIRFWFKNKNYRTCFTFIEYCYSD